jgi:hypothetical protein
LNCDLKTPKPLVAVATFEIVGLLESPDLPEGTLRSCRRRSQGIDEGV